MNSVAPPAGLNCQTHQANPDDDGHNDEHDHSALPWYVPLGSGNPDCHALIIAERKDICRLVASVPSWVLSFVRSGGNLAHHSE
jgi:hypothetical protein